MAIVSQIAALVDGDTTLDLAYLKAVAGKSDNPVCLHPANFRIPRKWALDREPTWSEWKDTIQSAANSDRITQLRARDRIVDHRYSPLDTENRLFHSVNPVRGLGLLLYGLLRKDLNLPTLWNGPGHADVLGMIFPVLLADMTCSSWTLGVLQGCLQPRVTENLILQMMMAQFPNASWLATNDSAHDPKGFFNAMEVAIALERCQSVLESCQLSTLGHRARQLTPIDIKQLTQPDWSRTFSNLEVDVAGTGE